MQSLLKNNILNKKGRSILLKKFKILALGALLCLALPQSIFAASVQDDGIKITTPPVTAVEKQGYQEEWLQREDDPVVRVDQEVKVDIKPLIDQKATNIWLEFWKNPDASKLYFKYEISDDGKKKLCMDIKTAVVIQSLSQLKI